MAFEEAEGEEEEVGVVLPSTKTAKEAVVEPYSEICWPARRLSVRVLLRELRTSARTCESQSHLPPSRRRLPRRTRRVVRTLDNAPGAVRCVNEVRVAVIERDRSRSDGDREREERGEEEERGAHGKRGASSECEQSGRPAS